MHASELLPGTVVGVPAVAAGGLVTVTHVGIVSRRARQSGLPMIYNASKRTGRVMHETWAEFTQGEQAQVIDLRGDLPDSVILARAASRLGDEWGLFFSNCEHYVYWCHGLEPESPQLREGVGKAVLATGAALAGAWALGKLIDAMTEQPKRRRR
ncbi:MAG: lecithin retinol acyltransferase family protein [Myxococcota bacterium]